MSVITTWITNIILLILFASIFELLLPNSKMQRYVKLVVGLMLLMVMLQPLLSIFQTDPEEWLADLSSWSNETHIDQADLELKTSELEKQNMEFISGQMAMELKNGVSREIEQKFNVDLLEVFVEFSRLPENDEDFYESLKDVNVLIQEKGESIEEDSTAVKVVQIDPVSIERRESKDEEVEVGDTYEDILTFLSTRWAIPETKIQIQQKVVQ
ncbi:stage III sporulation protein AF [Evansella sp. AB-rgal1]|uniref:stage III sporulation protein AF n=1 Tax=Evansella sp. AB-rgal1 TaxID=3242696 RepID=UPI00359E4E38